MLLLMGILTTKSESSCELGDVCMLSITDIGFVKKNHECEHYMKLSARKKRLFPICGWEGNQQMVCCPFEIVSVTEMCKRFHDNLNNRIIGGSECFIGEFPHFASLGYRLENMKNEITFLCGGSLISEKFVLTAGHCCKDSRRPVVVRLGKVKLNRLQRIIE